jgi:outer membrane cobalamin receptor
MLHFIINRRILFAAGIAFAGMACIKGQSVDTTRWHELPGVTVVESMRRSRTKDIAPVQRMERRQIEALGTQNLSEAVRQFSGVTVNDYGGIGGLKTVSVRSLGSKHTAVAYDGVCVSDIQSGQVDIGRFSLENVDNVMLVIGQGDEIFQTARMYASASALQIETAQPSFSGNARQRILMKLKGGSFGLISPMLRYEHKLGRRSSVSALAEATSADGKYPFTLTNGSITTKEIRQNSDIRSLSSEANLYLDLPGGGKIRAKAYTYNSERGLPGSIILYGSNTIDRLRDDNFFMQASYRQALNRHLSIRTNIKYNYAFSHYSTISDNYSGGRQDDRNTQHEYYASAGALYTPAKRISISLNSDFSFARLHNNFLNSPKPERVSSLSVLAVRYQSEKITATGSILATWMEDHIRNGKRPDNMKRLSPALGISYRPMENIPVRLRLSYKDIFRTPTFADLYYLRLGNTRLKPEKTKQFNAGITCTLGETFLFKHLIITADTYYNNVEDKIVAYPTMYVWKMVNMGKVDIRGIDLGLSSEISLPVEQDKYSLSLACNYSYREAIDLTDPESKTYRHYIPYTPVHSGSGSALFNNPYVNIAYIFTSTGERYSLPQNIKSNLMPGYAEHNITLNRRIPLRRVTLALQAEALNIAGANYDVIHYYPMPGRSYRFNISIEY